MPEWIGQTIGKVRVDKYLARGGMAEVYLGTHLSLDRPVAIKVLHSFIESDPELLERFQREAKAVAGLRHSNIVQVFDFDTHDGHPYIVMEYLKGPSLASYLQTLHRSGQKLSFEQIGQLLKSIILGIDYAHSQGIVHRDIKPANIILHSRNREFEEDTPLTKSVEAIITDFGLARIAHSGQQTASGFVSGTPAYMSPEQARGSKVDHRTDIYSLGIILYELLAGRVPFEADTAITVIFKHINDAPPPIEDIYPELQAVIDKALTKFPEDRYNSGNELLVDFYNAVGMRLEAETIHSLRSHTPRSTAMVIKKKKPALSPLWIGTGIFVCGCVSFLLLSGVIGTGLFVLPRLNTTETPTSVATEVHNIATEAPLVTDEAPVGVLRFQDGAAMADQITINANLDNPAEGSQYEAWLIDDSGEQRRSIGVLTAEGDGAFSLTYVDEQSRNLLGQYSHMEITLEPVPDTSPNPSGDVKYSSGIPGRALAHIRHLIVSTEESPNLIGMIDGLKNNAILVNQTAEALLVAYEAGKPKDVRSNAESLINLVVGKQDALYLDWNGDGTTSDPGDGYGILLNGDQTGYVGGVHHHSSYSADADDSTPDIRMHNGHVEISIHNIEEWAIELRDITERIVQAPDGANVEADVRKAVALANQILNGLDVNGNELIEPIAGEGGALTAYQHAYYMADMPILAGKDRMPATGK
ncbi:MAG: protein kinase [Anaerolineales bacterium]|uniref:protein kinase domain-containing protein n=1 Tax=Candidatus Villigracilis affinis TaxID=3140682 RepID=UPI001D947CCA|nr:protein kinase [Anaerolineales bacterium]MBK9604497.1 protein kinase [Anaerolineales bacterium]MBL0343705.1 protein kinase [Anaerolineales bacterium]